MKKRLMIAVGFGIIVMMVIYFVPSIRHMVRTTVTVSAAHLSKAPAEPFPQTAEQSGPRQRIIDIVKQEYDKRPVSYDQNVMRYTQGNNEAWCADFVTWTMQQAGVGLINPNSGSWRIPGVYTLKEYYEEQGRYEAVDNYRPRPGDVAIFIGRHTADMFSTEHTAIVIKVDGDSMTTIGGNEGGHVRLTTQRIRADENSLVGFGTLATE